VHGRSYREVLRLFYGGALPLCSFDPEALNRPLNMPALKSFRMHGNAITVRPAAHPLRHGVRRGEPARLGGRDGSVGIDSAIACGVDMRTVLAGASVGLLSPHDRGGSVV
jgi:hypothetical protein